MLTAKYIDTAEELDITKINNPRETIDRNRLCCKFCNGKVSIKQGLLRAKHFFHISLCTTDFERHPESPQHNLGKEIIANHIKTNWEEYGSAEIKFEYILSDVKRIADIAMVFPSGWVVVHEIQLASITTEHLQNRTDDYRKLGIDTIWWLGKSANTKANQEWCIDRFGFSLSIDYAILDAEVKSLQKGKAT